MKRILVLALLTTAAACDRGPEEVPEPVREARRESRRLACLSTELVRAADEDLRTLEGTVAAAGEGPEAVFTRRAAGAAMQYSQVYLQHAELRQSAAATADSAVNHSAASEDSLRFASRAERFVISAPEAGTVESNVFLDYERNLASLRADEDHPCNWDLEEE